MPIFDQSSKPPDAAQSAPSTPSASRSKVPRCRSPREPADQNGLSNYASRNADTLARNFRTEGYCIHTRCPRRQNDPNRRMNETLEAMARAIFQDWFVDFGPVRAKME